MHKKLLIICEVLLCATALSLLGVLFVHIFGRYLDNSAWAIVQMFTTLFCTGIIFIKCFVPKTNKDDQLAILGRMLPYFCFTLLSGFAAFLGIFPILILRSCFYHFMNDVVLAEAMAGGMVNTFLTVVCAGFLIYSFKNNK